MTRHSNSDKPTLRHLRQLKQDYRATPEDDPTHHQTYQRYRDAQTNAGFLRGLAAYLSD